MAGRAAAVSGVPQAWLRNPRLPAAPPFALPPAAAAAAGVPGAALLQRQEELRRARFADRTEVQFSATRHVLTPPRLAAGLQVCGWLDGGLQNLVLLAA